MTALKKFPDVREFAPSRPSILDTRAQFFLVFLRLATTGGQSSSVDVMMRPRYLNAAMLVSGRPYARNADSVHTRTSSAASLRRLLFAPLAH